MRTIGFPGELERRRWLAVQRVLDGCSTDEVADFMGVDVTSVRRWWRVFRSDGFAGLAARSVSGRPPKLERSQEKIVRRWLADSPTTFGFATELWTCPRLARLIEEEWGVRFCPRYLSRWLRARGFSPQRPRRVPRERDEEAITAWLEQDWPRIKKRPGSTRRGLSSLTRAVC
jgi:transposase